MVRIQCIGLSLASAITSVALLGSAALADWSTPLYGARGASDVRLSVASGKVAIHWIEREGQVYAPAPFVGFLDSEGSPPSSWSPNSAESWGDADMDICLDGKGGAIIAGKAPAPVPEQVRLSAQHILADGNNDPGWGPGGVTLSPTGGAPSVAGDGAGGAFVCWAEPPDGVGGLFLTRVLANGSIAPGWPIGGRMLNPDGPGGYGPASTTVQADGQGGVVVLQLNPSQRLFRFRGDGTPAPGWPSSGLVVTTSEPPRLCVASDAGTYLAWTDGGGSGPVRVLRVTPEGAFDPRWPGEGRPVGQRRARTLPQGGRVSVRNHSFSSPVLAPDHSAGVYAVWTDVPAASPAELRGTRMTADGSVVPGWDAIDLIGASGSIAHGGRIAAGPDDEGGLLAAWDDSSDPTTTTTMVHVVRWQSSGQRPFDWPEGTRLRPAVGTNGSTHAVTGNGSGRALVAWRENRSWPFGVLHITQVGPGLPISETMAATGSVGGPVAGARVDGLRPEPSLFRDRTTVHFRLREAGRARIAISDLAGRQVRTLVDTEKGPGAHQAEWDGRDDSGRPLGAGTYFLRMTVNGRPISGHAKAVLLR